MKNLMITTAIVTLLSTTVAWANHDGMVHDHETVAESTTQAFDHVAGKDKVFVSVNGLVCDFCARALEKVFSKRDEVVGIHVDLDKGQVLVAMKEGQTINDETLTQLITDSGYNVTAIQRGE